MIRPIRAGVYRLKTHLPRACALLAGELPLRDVANLSVSRPPTGHAIPNIVYQTWISPRFGRTHAHHLGQFRSLNDDFSFQFFDDEQVENYMRAAYQTHPIYEVFGKSLFGPLKADIWRYCIIYEKGGFYCDIGKAPNPPLRGIVSSTASGIISYEHNTFACDLDEPRDFGIAHPNHTVMNWMFGFAPRHPLLARVIDGIAAKYAVYKGQVVENPKAEILKFTGPVHFTQCVHEFARLHGLSGLQQAGIDFDDRAMTDMPGSYVRYIEMDSYSLAKRKIIVM